MSKIAWEAPIKQPWFSTPWFERILNDSSFTNFESAQLRQFAEQGFLIFDPGITNIDYIANDLRKNVPYPVQDGKPFNRVQDYWRENRSARELACHPSVLDTLTLIYQRPVIPFQTLNFPVGTQQAAHSDTIHFNSIPERWMCGVWIALEDVDRDNGPLFYYPGSHKLPIFDMHDFGLSPRDSQGLGQSYPIYERIVAEMLEASQLKRVELHLKKGQALIWEANLFHGGSPIRDHSRTRLSQVTHYYFEGCSYYGPLQSDVPLGQVVWRHVEDLVTGNRTRHTYNGKAAIAPLFNGLPQMLRLAEPVTPSGGMIAAGQTVHLSSQQAVDAHCLSGWSTAEPLGVWSTGEVSGIRFETEETAHVLELSLSAFIGQPNRFVRLEISLDGCEGETHTASIETFNDELEHVVTISLPPRSGRFDLKLRTTTPVSPASLGISADTRKLGVRLGSLRILAHGAALPTQR